MSRQYRVERDYYLVKSILGIIKSIFPTYYELAQRVYSYKCTDEGRTRFMDLLVKDRSELARELKPVTNSLTSFWDEIFKKIDEIRASGTTPIQFFRMEG